VKSTNKHKLKKLENRKKNKKITDPEDLESEPPPPSEKKQQTVKEAKKIELRENLRDLIKPRLLNLLIGRARENNLNP